ncbi:aminopeptidase [Desulfohalobium retbaense]|uniref:Peptidase M29 aminopeptidase II n=1 Tax=Desulfohalobium retbaense (strain ATCC 49708 / DSM 5692 / JCM 16813 / HR100) TaxID=485915 RepID=C8WZV3_DESRD|nr:aminopeptidase [Desulfohalobium retbaense]ACV67578.1 peptidase M29 aminopeptidase II [Desulfohalobium retbaense DSM 5692]
MHYLTQDQLEKYADVLLWGLTKARAGEYAAGDVVLLRYDLDARPLADLLFHKSLERGWHPVPRMGLSPQMEKSLFTVGGDQQLEFIAPGDKEFMRRLNANIALLAPESLTHLKDVDSKRIGKTAIARKQLRDILDEREAEGQFGWTLCLLPTEELAANAGLSIEEYTAQIIKACYLDSPDPVAEWERIYEQAGRIKSWLNSLDVDSFHVQSAHCDLTVTPGQDRQWVGISGHNIPSFELFLSPDWRGTQGIYYADQPSYRSGNLVQGVRLEFKDGEVVDVQAEEGEAFTKDQLDMDVGARRLGEFSLTDTRFSRIDKFMAHTLFDENFGGPYGNCHVAVGASYADTYALGAGALDKAKKEAFGFNDSALHWDLVNTEDKRVTARLKDGSTVLIYESGRFAGPEEAS